MAEPTPRAVLNHLIETCRDSERGFMAAADLVSDPTLKATFTSLAAERARFVQELQPHAQRLGGDDAGRGTTAASVHRRWMDVKARLTGHSDRSILAEVLRGDGVTLRVYEAAQHDYVPVTVRDVIDGHLEALRAAHGRLEALEGKLHA